MYQFKTIQMNSSQKLKDIVQEKYGQIAAASAESSCCGSSGCCGAVDYTVMAEDYSGMPGYVPEADMALGCGLPTEQAGITPGSTVVDLGSGAGNDCFVARAIAGELGRVIGIDMTPSMVERARANALKLGYSNVEFMLGDIENMPIPDHTADVVVSNCVMNLVPDKPRAFAETYRILKPGAHFSISDIVIRGLLPEGLRADAEMYAGCVAGALQQEEYLSIIRDTGFSDVAIQKEKRINLPLELLALYLDQADLDRYRRDEFGVYSITVRAKKP